MSVIVDTSVWSLALRRKVPTNATAIANQLQAHISGILY